MGRNIKQKTQDKKHTKKGNGFYRDQTPKFVSDCVLSCVKYIETLKIEKSNSTSGKDLIKMLSFLILRLVFFFFLAVLLLF